jgi:hypothetical protein
MPRRNNPARAEIRPDTGASSVVRIGGKQARSMIGESVFEKFANHCAFVQRFGVVLESRDEAAGVES